MFIPDLAFLSTYQVFLRIWIKCYGYYGLLFPRTFFGAVKLPLLKQRYFYHITPKNLKGINFSRLQYKSHSTFGGPIQKIHELRLCSCGQGTIEAAAQVVLCCIFSLYNTTSPNKILKISFMYIAVIRSVRSKIRQTLAAH